MFHLVLKKSQQGRLISKYDYLCAVHSATFCAAFRATFLHIHCFLPCSDKPSGSMEGHFGKTRQKADQPRPLIFSLSDFSPTRFPLSCAVYRANSLKYTRMKVILRIFRIDLPDFQRFTDVSRSKLLCVAYTFLSYYISSFRIHSRPVCIGYPNGPSQFSILNSQLSLCASVIRTCFPVFFIKTACAL